MIFADAALRRELAVALLKCAAVWACMRRLPQCFHTNHCRALATLACATCLACTDGVLVATAMVLILALVPRACLLWPAKTKPLRERGSITPRGAGWRAELKL